MNKVNHLQTVFCAVIGNPIAHSLSPVIHQNFAKQAGMSLRYEKIQGDDTHFELQVIDFFKSGGKGLNVTLPYKHRAFLMADSTTPRCQEAQAANTLWMKDGLLYADNTDGAGLIKDLHRYITIANKTVLILGAGGAARGIISPLLSETSRLTVINRTREKALTLQESFPQIQCMTLDELETSFDVIINATSAGLGVNQFNLPEILWRTQPFCYDLAYKAQGNTPFVSQAKTKKCIAHDGLGMLIEQAAEAFFIWHGFKPETERLLQDYKLR